MTVEVKAVSDEAGNVSQSELDILNDESSDNSNDESEVIKEDNDDLNIDDPDDSDGKDDSKDDDDQDVEEEEKEVENEDDAEPDKKQPVKFKEISQKYPKFFKEFPEVRRTMIEAHQYSQLFDDIETAKEASAKAEVFTELSDALLTKGDSFPLIENLAKSGTSENFERFAESILPAIHKQNPEIYTKITVPIIKRIIRAVYNDGVASNNTNLVNSSKLFTQFLFGTTKLEILNEEKKAEVKEDPEKVDLKNKLAENLKVQEQKFFSSVQNITEPQLKKQIEKFIKTEDKGKLLSKFTQDAIIEKALTVLDQKLSQDKEHMKIMAKLRDQAARSNFAGSWEPRVSSAYLGRATNLLQSIQRQLVAQALGTKPQSAGKKMSSSSTTSNNGNHVPNDPKKVFRTNDPKKKMTDREFLDAD